jgi:hypothetical protein
MIFHYSLLVRFLCLIFRPSRRQLVIMPLQHIELKIAVKSLQKGKSFEYVTPRRVPSACVYRGRSPRSNSL